MSAAPAVAASAALPWREQIEKIIARDFGDVPEAGRIAQVYSSALTEGTAENYSRHFVRFATWCERQPDRPSPLPATTDTVVRWLASDVCAADKVKAKCGELMQRWKDCFAAEMQKAGDAVAK